LNASADPQPVAVADDYDWRRGARYAAVSVLIGFAQGFTVYGVNNNLGALQGALGATAAEASWLSTAYFATAVSAVTLLTKMRLQYGLVRFANWSLAVFVLVGLLYLAAPNLGSAIAVRAAVGFAAAPLIALANLYMVQAMPARLAPAGLIIGFATLQFGSPLARIVAEPLFDLFPGHGLPLWDLALALATFAGINAVPLRPPPPQQVFHAGDGPAFMLYATGLALLCIVVGQGRTRWWTDTAWIGWCLVAGIACLAVFALVELRREHPLVDLRWIAGTPMWRFALGVLLFRIVLSEQPVGAVSFLNIFGLNNDQMHGLFGWVVAGTALGFAISVAAWALRSLRLSLLAALVLVFVAALIDARSTSLTRVPQLIVTQTLIAIATAMFLAASLVLGLLPILQSGGKNVVSFLAMFSGAQNMGSLLGSAWLGTFVDERQKLYLSHLAGTLTLTDPPTAARVAQGAAAYAGTIGDTMERGALGVTALAGSAAREAWVLAYDDLFLRIALIAAITFVGLAVCWTIRWWCERGEPGAVVAA
jgi:hypothetical protein